MIIGLTGGIGSGKSTVAQFFRELGTSVIDSDAIVHHLLTTHPPTLQAILQRFGHKIIQTDGTLNRRELRAIIFATNTERYWLENLLHPQVKAEIFKRTAILLPNQYGIVEIPLLIEARFQDVVDHILIIDCPEKLQIQRTIKRDATTKDAVQSIMDNQSDRLSRLAFATEVLDNTGTLQALQIKVAALHQYYIELSK